MAVLRYLPKNGLLTSGQVLFEGRDLFTMTAPSCAISGATASRWSTRTPKRLNPTIRVGEQVAEVFRHHRALPTAPRRPKQH